MHINKSLNNMKTTANSCKTILIIMYRLLRRGNMQFKPSLTKSQKYRHRIKTSLEDWNSRNRQINYKYEWYAISTVSN